MADEKKRITFDAEHARAWVGAGEWSVTIYVMMTGGLKWFHTTKAVTIRYVATGQAVTHSLASPLRVDAPVEIEIRPDSDGWPRGWAVFLDRV